MKQDGQQPDGELCDHGTREQALEIHRRLLDIYGEQHWDPSVDSDPVGTLVNTILSQNTNDRNRDIAYHQLRDCFPTWEAVRDAPAADVISAIAPAGLAPTKGPRVQRALRTITESQGALSLEFLRSRPLEEARAWLIGLDGVGPKTAAIVLLFAMGRPAFPVDTHIHRVTRRLGLIPPRTSREQAHVLLEQLLPAELYYTYHLNIIEHGRSICHARKPRCKDCTLRQLCCFYSNHVGGKDDPALPLSGPAC